MKDEYIERISEYEARADAPRLIAMFEAQEREAISEMRAYAKEMGYA